MSGVGGTSVLLIHIFMYILICIFSYRLGDVSNCPSNLKGACAYRSIIIISLGDTYRPKHKAREATSEVTESPLVGLQCGILQTGLNCHRWEEAADTGPRSEVPLV